MLNRIRLMVPALALLALPAALMADPPKMIQKDANDRPVGIILAQGAEPLTAPRSAPAQNAPLDPVPLYRADMGGFNGQMQPPPLPPHAWPTYAPYNNYSRVAYPNLYPSCAFPHIGPFYPFPKAPLGWRKVMLEFDDGHWYIGSYAGNRDWWNVRYW